MPETSSSHEGQGPLMPATRARVSLRNVLVLVLLMAAEAMVIIVIMKRPRSEEDIGGGAAVSVVAQTHSEKELMAPRIDIPGIVTSIKVDDAGARLHTLTTGIAIKIGRVVEGKPESDIDLEYLNNVYLPKVQQLEPAIKDALIREITGRSYGELLQPSVQQQILDDIKRRANDMLKSYGLEPRIVEVYWTLWHFS
ncbi:MAG: flagellar basal body-associated FliL family protein [Planctomycetes bacterium]|nr:flagellar basal body-associated FliL family protein [Planctomycetota bacterium]